MDPKSPSNQAQVYIFGSGNSVVNNLAVNMNQRLAPDIGTPNPAPQPPTVPESNLCSSMQNASAPASPGQPQAVPQLPSVSNAATPQSAGQSPTAPQLAQKHRNHPIYHGEPEGFIHVIKKGFVTVINNMVFQDGAHPTRNGTTQDVIALKKFFDDKLGFAFRVTSNLKAKEIEEHAREVSEKELSSYHVMFYIVLSHGDENGLIGVDGVTVSVDTILSYFKADVCKSLAGKPKVFIFQACRGDLDDTGATVVRDAKLEVPSKCVQIPTESDFLVAYACAKGYTALRNEEKGTWFIQAMMQIFHKFYDREHLLDMFTRVNYVVASFHSSAHQKQAPCQDVRLTQRCYFKDYLDNYEEFMQGLRREGGISSGAKK